MRPSRDYAIARSVVFDSERAATVRSSRQQNASPRRGRYRRLGPPAGTNLLEDMDPDTAAPETEAGRCVRWWTKLARFLLVLLPFDRC